MSELAALALFIFPLLSFVSAGIFEFRRDSESLQSLTRLAPILIAVALSIVLLIDLRLPYFSFHPWMSKTFVVLSLFIALSGLVCRYKSRVTAGLICIGGLVLTVLWLTNRWIA